MTGMLVRREPISASLVRRSLAADLAPHDVDETSLHEVTLVATELVGNAIRHGNPAEGDGVDVSAARIGDRVRSTRAACTAVQRRSRRSASSRPGVDRSTAVVMADSAA